MKRFAYYIALLPLVALCGCSHDDIDEITAIGNGKIVIESKLDNMHITRADIADTSKERTVEYIDVFAVDANGNIAYYERNTSSGNNGGAAEDGAGTLTLNVARRAKDADGNFYFAADAKYSFYLVANAKATEAEMGAIATLSDLQLLVQDDSFDPKLTTEERQTLLHLSGTSQGKNNDGYETPQTFLMDAVAASGTETSVVVNPATGSVSNLDLTAEFKRAAAKIIVNITQGADVEFHKQIDTEGSVYEFYKLPANTFVLPHEESLVGIELINTTPMVPNDETFIWQADAAATNQLQIIGYAYAHSWDNTTWANETSLILNIPMMWNKDNSDDHSKEAEASKSWYKVPLSQQKMFERNKCYVVNINVNAVGAANRSTAIELRDIEYKTLDWQSVGVDVGDNDERPEFLVLNTDLVEMYNVNFDNTSLSFSSSSPITSIELADVYSHNIGTEEFSAGTDSYSAYYLNKYNAKTALNSTIRGTISASPEADVLNGAISIISPIVPATAAEIEEQIKEALGEAPTAPTLAVPTYSGTIPTEPTVVPAAAEPQLDDYVKSSTTNNSSWVNNATYNATERTRTITVTEYQYITNSDGSITFQQRTRTQTETQTRDGFWDDWGASTYSDWSNWSNWTNDTTTQRSWDAAVTAYNAYNQYLADKAAYDAAVEALNNDPAYKQYLADKAAYDNAWAAYNEKKAQYDEQADAIREAAGGEETHYNTIRFLEFKVTNEQGLTATFRVMQYPTIFITNAVGWYSYREDFKNLNSSSHATTYHISGDRIGGIRYNQGTYTLYNGSSSNTSFWRSKVSATPEPSHQGTSNWDFYYWNSNASSATTTNGTDNENTRMYNIKVTATSSKYTIGVPRRVNVTQAINYSGTTVNKTYDTTESSEENSKLVSPSFMTASRLGVVKTENISYSSSSGTTERETEMYNLFSYHCSNYVEVKQVIENGVTKKVVYDDWRLPTAAEIGIIIELQPTSTGNNSADKAIDYLLNAGYYYSASGPVKNNNTATSISVRCVRDAVNEPAAKNLTE